MRIAIGSDHHGLARKGTLIAALEASGHIVLDLGVFSADPVDYPDYARVVGQAVLRNFVEAGVLVCGSGMGAAIAANKIRGVRAAAVAGVAAAIESRQQLDANVLCLSAEGLDEDAAVGVTLAWVGARFSGDEVHARQVAKLAQLEAAPTPEGAGQAAAAAPGRAQKAAESAPPPASLAPTAIAPSAPAIRAPATVAPAGETALAGAAAASASTAPAPAAPAAPSAPMAPVVAPPEAAPPDAAAAPVRLTRDALILP